MWTTNEVEKIKYLLNSLDTFWYILFIHLSNFETQQDLGMWKFHLQFAEWLARIKNFVYRQASDIHGKSNQSYTTTFSGKWKRTCTCNQIFTSTPLLKRKRSEVHHSHWVTGSDSVTPSPKKLFPQLLPHPFWGEQWSTECASKIDAQLCAFYALVLSSTIMDFQFHGWLLHTAHCITANVKSS